LDFANLNLITGSTLQPSVNFCGEKFEVCSFAIERNECAWEGTEKEVEKKN